jgi:cyclase
MRRTGVDAVVWALRAAELGAGELMVTSINNEGTGKGFDLELTRRIAESVPIPVIAGGGAGKLADVAEVIGNGRADAVCLASILHYDAIRHAGSGSHDYSEEGNTEFLRKGGAFSRIRTASIPDVKAYLAAGGIDCRQPSLQPASA